MMWLAVMGLCTLGAMALDGYKPSTTSSETKESQPSKTQEGFSRDFVRSNLRKFDYGEWDVDDVMERLSDNWFRQAVEKNMRRGECFQDAYESTVKEFDR